jgi:hypothetical protein
VGWGYHFVIRAWDNHTFLRRKPKENVLDIIAWCAVLKPDSTNGYAWANATLRQDGGILKGLCGYWGCVGIMEGHPVTKEGLQFG